MEIVSNIPNAKTTEAPAEIKTKITDVNIDCLEEIFKYLSITDLLNIADTCVRLRKAAFFVFRCTYMPKLRIAYNIEHRSWSMEYYRSWNFPFHLEMDEKLDLFSLRTCFQLLRCFGSYITFMTIEDGGELYPHDMRDSLVVPYIMYERLVRYINEYCYESLEVFFLAACPKGVFDQMKNSFLKVEKLQTDACILKTTLWKTLFPKLKNLHYYHTSSNPTKYSHLHGIENKFPHLEKLTLGDTKKFVSKFLYKNYNSIFQLNPQIVWLELRLIPDLNLLQNIARFLPALEHLRILINTKIGEMLEYNQIHFKNLKSFAIQNSYYPVRPLTFDSYRFPCECDFPFTFDQLETFCCGLGYCFESADEIYKFFKKNSSIKRLTLSYNGFIELNPFEIASILPLLEYIRIPDYLDDLDNFIDIVSKIKTLRIVEVLVEWNELKYLWSGLHLKDIEVISLNLGYNNYESYTVQLKMA